MSSTINSTDASVGSVVTDEAVYANSAKTKKLLRAIDSSMVVVEHKLQQSLSRFLFKPLRRRLKKSESAPLAQMQDTAVEDWRKTTQDAIKDIINDNDIKHLLYTLDELIIREKKRRGDDALAWRPTGRPKVDMEAYTVLRMLEYRHQLKGAVENVENELATKICDVERGRKECAELDKDLSAVGKEIKKHAKLVKSKTDKMANRELRTKC